MSLARTMGAKLKKESCEAERVNLAIWPLPSRMTSVCMAHCPSVTYCSSIAFHTALLQVTLLPKDAMLSAQECLGVNARHEKVMV